MGTDLLSFHSLSARAVSPQAESGTRIRVCACTARCSPHPCAIPPVSSRWRPRTHRCPVAPTACRALLLPPRIPAFPRGTRSTFLSWMLPFSSSWLLWSRFAAVSAYRASAFGGSWSSWSLVCSRVLSPLSPKDGHKSVLFTVLEFP